MEALQSSEEVVQLPLFNATMFPLQQLTSVCTTALFYLPIYFTEHFYGREDDCAPGLISSSRTSQEARAGKKKQTLICERQNVAAWRRA